MDFDTLHALTTRFATDATAVHGAKRHDFDERYAVIRDIGRGTFGVVRLIRKRRATGTRSYVVKELAFFTDAGAFQKRRCDAALNELRVMRKLSHPHIVRYAEAFEQADRLLLVMEHCEGGDLGEFLRKRRGMQSSVGSGSDARKKPLCSSWPFIPEETIVRWMLQLLSAMAYLHSRGTLHRDVKPANIFLVRSPGGLSTRSHAQRSVVTSGLGERKVASPLRPFTTADSGSSRSIASDPIPFALKLGDFGLAKVLEHVDDQAVTRCGTPFYFSPEMFRGTPYTDKNDVWGLGCVLFELMTGEHPFEGPSVAHICRSVADGLRRDPNPSGTYSRALCDMLRLMLSLDDVVRPSAASLLGIPLWPGCAPPL